MPFKKMQIPRQRAEHTILFHFPFGHYCNRHLKAQQGLKYSDQESGTKVCERSETRLIAALNEMAMPYLECY